MPRTSHFARRYLRHTHVARRGQALLVAVLVLFAVATLAALFTAIIGAQLSQVARHGDVTKLRNLTEAGLWLANEQLTYSVKGADWRPPDDPYLFGDGRIELSVTYWPPPPPLAQGAFSPSPQSGRFILITSTATFPDYPFLRYTMVALKPLLLTDYARFITDRHETGRPARLGVSGVELGGTPRPDYLFRVQGPIRSNTDLVAYGRSSVALQTADDPAETGSTWAQLGIPRDDRIEVAGFLRPDPSHPVENRGADALALTVSGEPRASDLFLPLDEAQADDYAAAFPDWLLDPSILHTSSRILADLPGYTSVGGWFPGPANSVPRVQPPDLLAEHPDTFRKRYLLLTRDSGVFEPDAATGDLHNTGEYGWGFMNLGGIYIDNIHDIQYEHDLETLRLNWLASVGAHDPLGDERPDADAPLSGPADWWDKTGRYYSPPAVEIVLHGEAPCPYIEIIRHDPQLHPDTGEQYYWCDLSGVPITPTSHPADYVPTPYESNCGPGAAPGTFRVKNNTAIFPFPPNGVIYAEGNVRIRGIMPPIRDELGNSGTSVPLATAEDMPYLAPSRADLGRTRRFDLQVVSAGTIYVEGDLLTSSAAGLIADTYEVDRHYGSRLALLAHDYVCVNTTALNPRPVQVLDPFLDPATDEYYFYNDRYPDYPPGGYPPQLVFQGSTDAALNLPSGAKDVWDGDPVETDPLNIQFLYRNVRLQHPYLSDQIPDLRLMLGHSGFHAIGEPEGGFSGPPDIPAEATTGTDEPAVEVDIYFDNMVAGTTWPWDVVGAGLYTFLRPAVAAPETADQSDHWYLQDLDRLEHLPNAYQEMQVHRSGLSVPYLTGNSDVITFTSRVSPVRQYDDDNNVEGWQIHPRDLAYILGPVAVAPPCRLQGRPTPAAPLPVSIEAMIYAQNGSWFIIPGPWFNEDPEETTYTGDSPGYREPLNIQISVYGAVTENMPADIGAAAEWTSKWSGPQTRGFGGYLRYAYDPLLRWSRWDPDSKTWAPRFPNLPVTSDMLIWGERVSGKAGA